MDAAIKAVKSGALSIRKAAIMYGVHRTTLGRHLLGKNLGKVGKERKFNPQEEQFIAELVLKSSETGISFDRRMLARVILRMCKSKGLQPKFSDSWLRSFLQRHPQLSHCMSRGSDRKKQPDWTSEDRETWLSHLSDLNIEGYLSDPDGIYNLSESGFSLTEGCTKVFARRGGRVISNGSDKEIVSVLICGTASGKLLPPAILLDGKTDLESDGQIDLESEEKIDEESSDGGTSEKCRLVWNPSEITDNDHFSYYIKQQVLPSMTADKNIIFLGGYSSQVNNEEFLLACLESGKNIKVVCLPPGETDKLQPMDTSVFNAVKKYWKDFRKSHAQTSATPADKQDFVSLLLGKWPSFNIESNLRSGFRKSGIYPYDPRAVMAASDLSIPEVNLSEALTLKNIYAPQFETIRTALRQIPAITESGIESIIQYAIRVGEGFIPDNPLQPD